MTSMTPTPASSDSTLDEPISDTILRDVQRIAKNLQLVLIPIQFGGTEDRNAVVRDWDLWGPLVFSLLLSVSLATGSSVRSPDPPLHSPSPRHTGHRSLPHSAHKAFPRRVPSTPQSPSKVFSLVFGTAVLGAIVLTVNVALLGGRIAFFGSMCLLGYCIFPIALVALISLFVKSLIVRVILLSIAFVWSCWAGVPFIGGTVPDNRQGLAVYPLFLLYAFLCWITLLR